MSSKLSPRATSAFSVRSAAPGPAACADGRSCADRCRAERDPVAGRIQPPDGSRESPAAGVALPPLGAVLASADLRVRVDRETAQGVFTLAGDVLRPGVNRVPLVSGATLIEGSASGRPLPLSADGPCTRRFCPGPALSR